MSDFRDEAVELPDKSNSEMMSLLKGIDESAIGEERDFEGEILRLKDQIEAMEYEDKMNKRLLKLQKDANATLENRIKMMERKTKNLESKLKQYDSSIVSETKE